MTQNTATVVGHINEIVSLNEPLTDHAKHHIDKAGITLLNAALCAHFAVRMLDRVLKRDPNDYAGEFRKMQESLMGAIKDAEKEEHELNKIISAIHLASTENNTKIANAPTNGATKLGIIGTASGALLCTVIPPVGIGLAIGGSLFSMFGVLKQAVDQNKIQKQRQAYSRQQQLVENIINAILSFVKYQKNAITSARSADLNGLLEERDLLNLDDLRVSLRESLKSQLTVLDALAARNLYSSESISLLKRQAGL